MQRHKWSPRAKLGEFNLLSTKVEDIAKPEVAFPSMHALDSLEDGSLENGEREKKERRAEIKKKPLASES